MADAVRTIDQLEILLYAVGEEAEAAVVRDRLLRPWLIIENAYGDYLAYSYPTEEEEATMVRVEDLLMPLDVLHRPGKTISRDKVNQIALLLKATWDKAEPAHGVTLYPAAYMATFADMARAMVEAYGPPQENAVGMLAEIKALLPDWAGNLSAEAEDADEAQRVLGDIARLFARTDAAPTQEERDIETRAKALEDAADAADKLEAESYSPGPGGGYQWSIDTEWLRTYAAEIRERR